MFTTGAVTGDPSGTSVIADESGPALPKQRQGHGAAIADPHRDWRPGFRPDIEGLRAIAIILVVLYHCGVAAFTGGYVGVDVFFVISGFLITSQLVREVSERGRLRVGRFYARRMLRLLPAATVVISATVIAAWYWLPVTRLHELSRDALAANGYVLNYRLAHLGTDYRSSGSAPSALQHFWSLGVEEQFYLVIPLLLVLTMVLLRRRWVFTGTLALITAGSLWWSIQDTPKAPVMAYFGAPTRAWELGAGALLAMLAPTVARLPGLVAIACRWLGVALIAAAALLFDDTTSFPGYHALLPVGGAVAVIAAGCGTPGKWLTKQAIRSIGTRSYSWYLWHWPVLLIGPYALSTTFSTTDKLLAAAVAYLLAVVTYAALEHPLRSRPALREHTLRASAVGVLLTAAAVSVALVVPTLPSHRSLGVGKAEKVELAGPPSARERALSTKLSAATRVQNLPRNLTPTLKYAAYDVPAIERNGCFLGLPGTSTPKHCESLGDPHARTVAVLFGDSHAEQWYPALSTIARQRHWRLAVFTKGLCPAADVELTLGPVQGPYDACVAWRADAVNRIKALRPALVVMSSIADHGDLLDPKYHSVNGIWANGWSTTTKALSAPETKVVYLDDTPTAKEDVPGCLSINPRSVQECTQTPQLATGSQRRQKTAEAAAEAGASVIDPKRWFCATTSCPVVLGNILIYRDSNHISTPYIRLITPLLAEKLKLPATKTVSRRTT